MYIYIYSAGAPNGGGWAQEPNGDYYMCIDI